MELWINPDRVVGVTGIEVRKDAEKRKEYFFIVHLDTFSHTKNLTMAGYDEEKLEAARQELMDAVKPKPKKRFFRR